MTTDLYTTQKQKSGWESLADVAFFMWIVTAFFNERSAIGRLGLLFFMGSVALFIFFKTADIKKINNLPSAINMYFITYLMFYCYNYWRIHINGIIISYVTSADMLKTIGINGIFLYLIYKYCVMKNDMEYVLKTYVVAQIVNVIVVVVETGGDIFSGRLGGSSGVNANLIGTVLITCIPLLLQFNAKKKNWINIFLIMVCIFFIILTGSRKGLIGIVLALGIYFCMDSGVKVIKNLIITAFVVVIVYILVMNVDVLYNIAGKRFEALLSFAQGQSYDESSLASRNDYIQLGWKMILKNPWSGYGLDSFRVLEGAYGTYSHNNYVELLFGCGIIGTVLYYLGYLYILFGHIKLLVKHKVEESKPFIVIVASQIILEYTIVSYFQRQNIVFIAISLGALQLFKAELKRKVENDESVKQVEEGS